MERLGRVVENAGVMLLAPGGADLPSSIDRKIQHIAHAHRKAAVERHQVSDDAAVVLDVRSGEVLACAIHLDYDLNR